MAFLGLNFEDEDFEGDGRNWPILACDRLRKPNFIGLVSIARAANRVPSARPTLFSDSLQASWDSNPIGSSWEVSQRTEGLEGVDPRRTSRR